MTKRERAIEIKGGLIFVAWIAWVVIVMATAQHFGWLPR